MTTSPPTQDALSHEEIERLAWIEAELADEPNRPLFGNGSVEPCRNGHEITELEAEMLELKLKAANHEIARLRAALATPINGEDREVLDHGLDLDALKNVTVAAGEDAEGSWFATGRGAYVSSDSVEEGKRYRDGDGPIKGWLASADTTEIAVHIAAFDPPTVLKLLAALTKADACLRALASREQNQGLSSAREPSPTPQASEAGT